MGAPTFQHEYEQAIALLPRPPEPEVIEPIGNNAVAEFDCALKSYRKSTASWRAQMLLYVPTLVGLFTKASRHPDPAAMRYMIDNIMPRILEVLDRSIKHVEVNIEPNLMREKIDCAAMISPDLAKALKVMRKKYRTALYSHRDFLIELRNKLKVVEWNYDPEARGGPSFTTADDLIASLRV